MNTHSRHGGDMVVSIVSHGHGEPVLRLLQALAVQSANIRRVVLTLNIPEAEPTPPEGGWPFVLEVRRNTRPLGFGRNHNLALADALESFVCVLNPDVELVGGTDPLARLQETASCPKVGCAYPTQVDAYSRVQDFERVLPTISALLRRRLLGVQDRRVDWVNAACLVFQRDVWNRLGGFDESYFMYCEDVDLCLRIRLCGLRLEKGPVSVIHAGRRASRRSFRHLMWHVRSLIRLWASPVFWRARQLLQSDVTTPGRINAP